MLVTKKAPDFTATAVLADGQIVEDFNLMENLGEKGAVLVLLPTRLYLCMSFRNHCIFKKSSRL